MDMTTLGLQGPLLEEALFQHIALGYFFVCEMENLEKLHQNLKMAIIIGNVVHIRSICVRIGECLMVFVELWSCTSHKCVVFGVIFVAYVISAGHANFEFVCRFLYELRYSRVITFATSSLVDM